jgi:hypothetical protein
VTKVRHAGRALAAGEGVHRRRRIGLIGKKRH